MVPVTSADFDRAYRAPLTLWGDVRVPKPLKELAAAGSGQRSLELGCGIGRYTRYLAQQGLHATGVDFSAVAIERARKSATYDHGEPPHYLVGDVTRLDVLREPFDFAFDVGCFHCLGDAAQRGYVAEVARLVKPSGTHLIWALDHTPADYALSPERARAVFAPRFELLRAESSRRRLVRSHWYWLQRRAEPTAPILDSDSSRRST